MSTLAPLVNARRAALAGDPLAIRRFEDDFLGEVDSIVRLGQSRIEVSMERLLE